MAKKCESAKKPATNTQKPARKDSGKLPPKRQRFVDEYLIDLNETQAAVRAGFSKKSAAKQGHRLYTNVHVRAAIDKAMAERAERTKVTQDYVVQGIKDTFERCQGLKAVRSREGQLVKTQTEDGEAAVNVRVQPDGRSKGRGTAWPAPWNVHGQG
jgi:phage terminase small subunit